MIPTTSYTPIKNLPANRPALAAIIPPLYPTPAKTCRQPVLYIRAEQQPNRPPTVHIIRHGKKVRSYYRPSQASIMRLQTLMRYYIITNTWLIMPHLSPYIGWTGTLKLAHPGGAI